MKALLVFGLWMPMIVFQSFCAMEEGKKELLRLALTCSVFPRYEKSYTVYGILDQKNIIAASCLLPIACKLSWPEERPLTDADLPVISGIRCICQKNSSEITPVHQHVVRSFLRFFLNKLIARNYNAARIGSLIKSYPKCLASQLLYCVVSIEDLRSAEGELKITF